MNELTPADVEALQVRLRAALKSGEVRILPDDSGYVVRPSRGAHRCPLPAEWIEGAIWRCPSGHLWQCVNRPQLMRGGYAAGGPAWEPASWWRRRRHGGSKATRAMGNENRTMTAKHFKPPTGMASASPLPGPHVHHLRSAPPPPMADPHARNEQMED